MVAGGIRANRADGDPDDNVFLVVRSSWRDSGEQDQKVVMLSWSPTSFVIVGETIFIRFGAGMMSN
jgi:hypothetical protein